MNNKQIFIILSLFITNNLTATIWPSEDIHEQMTNGDFTTSDGLIDVNRFEKYAEDKGFGLMNTRRAIAKLAEHKKWYSRPHSPSPKREGYVSPRAKRRNMEVTSFVILLPDAE